MKTLELDAPAIEKELDRKRKVLPTEEGQVTVKCRLGSSGKVRIWPCTVLRCHQTGKEAKLIHAENIGIYPQWLCVNKDCPFLLIFEGLPAACKSFDLIEAIPEPGGFVVQDISRNTQDVYEVSI